VATALAIRPGWLCLDLGCGIGGPASTIASLTAARIVGVNSNLGQLRALSRTRPRGEQSGIRGVSADFAHLPFAAGLFDCAYAFEALCHAVDLEAACREVHRVLRPGGVLGFSEWCLTEIFDPGNTLHGALRRTIEASYGVVRLRSRLEWRQALLQAGFRITTMLDQAERDDGNGDRDPWYRALLPRDRTLDSLGRRSSLRALQGAALSVAERCRLAPRGTAAIVRQLREGTAALVEAGRLGIFTPMLFVLATRRDAAST
jgi:sterol 24-C-methyltransferase